MDNKSAPEQPAVQAAVPVNAAGKEIGRVVVASMATRTGDMFRQLETRRAEALQRSAPQGVFVTLLYQSGWFVWWAEGPVAALREAMDRAQADSRHHSLHTLHWSRGPRLLLTAWSMMLSHSDESTVSFGRRVIGLREQIEKGRQYAPPSVLRRLAAPVRLAEATAMPDPECFHRIGVSSAARNEAFELVSWLATQYGTEPTRRRMAGEHDLDGSSDYVEFMAGAYPCRLIAVARSGLLHGMRRAYLTDWPNFLLLFCGEPGFDNALMSRMALACEGLPMTPLLLGVAPDAAAHERMAAKAREAGLDYVAALIAQPDDYAAIGRLIQDRTRKAGAPPSSLASVPKMAA